jgi:hypothetical protein
MHMTCSVSDTFFHGSASGLLIPRRCVLPTILVCCFESYYLGGAMKIDIWRILVVYMFGGIYCDADMYPTELMTETFPITSSDDSLFLSDAVSHGFIGHQRIHQ